MSINHGFELAIGTSILPAKKYENELAPIDSLAAKYQIRKKLNHPDYTDRWKLTDNLRHIFPIPQILQLECSGHTTQGFLFPIKDYVALRSFLLYYKAINNITRGA